MQLIIHNLVLIFEFILCFMPHDQQNKVKYLIKNVSNTFQRQFSRLQEAYKFQ